MDLLIWIIVLVVLWIQVLLLVFLLVLVAGLSILAIGLVVDLLALLLDLLLLLLLDLLLELLILLNFLLLNLLFGLDVLELVLVHEDRILTQILLVRGVFLVAQIRIVLLAIGLTFDLFNLIQFLLCIIGVILAWIIL